MRTRQTRLVIALLSGLAALPAMAEVHTSLTLSGFTVSLKDINLADSVTPSLSWAGYAQLSTYSYDDLQSGWTLNNYGGSTTSWNPKWTENGSRYTSSTAPAVTTASGLGQGQQHVASAGAGPSAMSVTHVLQTGSSGSSSASLGQSFTLSAGTEVSFSVVLDGGFSATAFPGSVLTPANTSFGGRSSAGLNAQIGAGTLYRNLSLNGNSSWAQTPGGFEQEIVGEVLRVTLKNEGTTSMAYQFYLNIGVNGQETISPVPEPASYALMALGLAAVGFAARRRKA